MIRACANTLRNWLQNRYLPWHLAVLAMALCAPALWLGWQTDDHFHRAALIDAPEAQELSGSRAEVFAYIKGQERARSPAKLFAFIEGDEDANRRAIARGFLPWWTHEGLRIAFFRPLTGLTHWIDYRIWPERPWLMHLHSLVWLGCVVVVAALFYRRTLQCAWVAGLAALLFAVDDAHGLPAVWLANRSATIGAIFGLLTLISYDRWRRDNWRMGAVLAPVTLLLGLLSNEGAVATGAYLIAYALFLDRDTWAGRLRALLPCVLTGVTWWVAYKLMGYGVTGCGVYVDPGTTPLQFLGALAKRAPILLLGQWALPADMQWLMSQRAAHITWLTALAFLAVVAAALAPLVRRDPLARFWTVGMLLSVLPACATFPSGRLLFFVGLGGMGLLAQLVAATLHKVDWLPTRALWRWPSRALCILLIVVHLAVAPLALTQAAGNVERFDGVCARAAASLPSDSAVRRQTVLIVNTPTYYVCAISALIRTLDSAALPLRTFVLGSGIHPMEIRRPDQRTLTIRPAAGFLAPPGSPQPGHEATQPLFDMRYGFPLLDLLYRDQSPMRVGQRIELADLRIEITSVTKDGRPAEATFRFAKALEDPFLRWLRWEDGAYVPFALPAVGETVRLPAVTVPF
ncbi:MAG: hypothetical protein ACYS7M_00990 [Planctomycetota bacterium]